MFYGLQFRPREVERVHACVQDAVDRGATLLCGTKALSDTCYPPTVLLDPPPDAMVNDHTAFRVDWMPFAGLKVSGQGTGGYPLYL